ncbi:PBP1A family penicillin-binding protein [candidate division WOR-3 bacterium]|uniref:PBP1A family penicillin-binding protein n=1 Tax=candidate division WOR-3 bacterium TaxID=2052148 RepID=A0A9D5QF46_UNCW3|nr:PBP1A family penicillin-binding protein [candidate division WOR-3 bacterium]MBD3365670.1 PBP1A family penicillin-binding protein [candidate division WOR-3 bacterium]
MDRMNEHKYLPAVEPPPKLGPPPEGFKHSRNKGKRGLFSVISKSDVYLFGLAVPGFIYAFLAGIVFIISSSAGKDLPAPESLQTYKPPLTSKVFDRNDNLIFEFYVERRDPVPLDSIPSELVLAFVTVEDKRYYKHWGISMPDVFRALLHNIAAGRIVEGASSISQQLARNMFLSFETTLIRKIKEAILAIQLERMYSKEEILEMYLNQVNFGHGAYGVEAAAQRYFDKHLYELSTHELCFLAALPRGGAYHRPYDNPEKVRARRDKFINALYEIDEITHAERDAALAAEIDLAPRRLPPNEAPYFVEEVRRYLERKYGSGFIYREGVYIYTTLDLTMQKAANEAVEKHLLSIESRKNLDVVKSDYDTVTFTEDSPAPKYLQGALVCVDVHTGEVLALVGGRDYEQSSFDRAVQSRRQPGSSFKPFVYTAALDNGFTPGDVEFDAPVLVRTGGYLYAPANWDRKFYGPMTLRQGLAQSRNLVAVRLARYVGPEMVVEYAHKMGITSPLKPVLSISLGAVEVSPLEMATAFSTLANGGYRVEPAFIRYIVGRDGELIEEWYPQQGEQVIPAQTAFLVTSMMQSVISSGTATVIRRRGFNRVAAGKTGTTDDFTDGWFVGFTPEIACAVWVGFDKRQTIYRGASGGSCAAPVWAEFMKEATADMPQSNFSMPEGIISRRICTLTGQLATEDCPQTREEYYMEGTEPTLSCQYHRLLKLRGGSREDFFRLDRRSHGSGLTTVIEADSSWQ